MPDAAERLAILGDAGIWPGEHLCRVPEDLWPPLLLGFLQSAKDPQATAQAVQQKAGNARQAAARMARIDQDLLHLKNGLPRYWEMLNGKAMEFARLMRSVPEWDERHQQAIPRLLKSLMQSLPAPAPQEARERIGELGLPKAAPLPSGHDPEEVLKDLAGELAQGWRTIEQDTQISQRDKVLNRAPHAFQDLVVQRASSLRPEGPARYQVLSKEEQAVIDAVAQGTPPKMPPMPEQTAKLVVRNRFFPSGGSRPDDAWAVQNRAVAESATRNPVMFAVYPVHGPAGADGPRERRGREGTERLKHNLKKVLGPEFRCTTIRVRWNEDLQQPRAEYQRSLIDQQDPKGWKPLVSEADHKEAAPRVNEPAFVVADPSGPAGEDPARQEREDFIMSAAFGLRWAKSVHVMLANKEIEFPGQPTGPDLKATPVLEKNRQGYLNVHPGEAALCLLAGRLGIPCFGHRNFGYPATRGNFRSHEVTPLSPENTRGYLAEHFHESLAPGEQLTPRDELGI